MMRAERDEQDDRNRNANQPKYDGAHEILSFGPALSPECGFTALAAACRSALAPTGAVARALPAAATRSAAARLFRALVAGAPASHAFPGHLTAPSAARRQR